MLKKLVEILYFFGPCASSTLEFYIINDSYLQNARHFFFCARPSVIMHFSYHRFLNLGNPRNMWNLL